MQSRYLISLFMAATLASPIAVLAADGHGAHGSGHAPGHMTHARAEQAIQGKGVLKAVKGDTVTLAHGPIPALKWPAMTMDFKLKDPALVRDLKPGATVTFELEPAGSGYVISAIRAE